MEEFTTATHGLPSERLQKGFSCNIRHLYFSLPCHCSINARYIIYLRLIRDQPTLNFLCYVLHYFIVTWFQRAFLLLHFVTFHCSTNAELPLLHCYIVPTRISVVSFLHSIVPSTPNFYCYVSIVVQQSNLFAVCYNPIPPTYRALCLYYN